MIRAELVRVWREAPGRPTVEALRGVGLAVCPGGLAVVLGRSGAGKTTLLEALAGLLPLQGGEVALEREGRRWSWGAGRPAPLEARRRVGLLFQFPERQLFGGTALEDVGWGLGGGSAAERALTRVELPSSLWRAPLRQLSRGEKRRVALAGLLAGEPEILLLDEPGVGLDPEGQALLWREVEAYRRERGAAVVVATHWPERFLPRADEVLCLAEGSARFRGPPGELPGAAVADRELSCLLPFGLRLRNALLREGGPTLPAERWAAAAVRWLAEEGDPFCGAPDAQSRRATPSSDA